MPVPGWAAHAGCSHPAVRTTIAPAFHRFPESSCPADLPALLALVALLVVPVAADEKVDHDFNWKLRREAAERPKVMQTLHVLTDVYGPRLTGSPNYKAAADWTVKQLTEWGLVNAHLEPWDFGHPGWTNERASGFVVAPYTDSLALEVVAWTPGTNGTVRGRAVQMVLPERPTDDDLAKFFEQEQANVKGKIVLVGKAASVPGRVHAARETPRRCGIEDAVRPEQPESQPDVARR